MARLAGTNWPILEFRGYLRRSSVDIRNVAGLRWETSVVIPACVCADRGGLRVFCGALHNGKLDGIEIGGPRRGRVCHGGRPWGSYDCPIGGGFGSQRCHGEEVAQRSAGTIPPGSGVKAQPIVKVLISMIRDDLVVVQRRDDM